MSSVDSPNTSGLEDAFRQYTDILEMATWMRKSESGNMSDKPVSWPCNLKVTVNAVIIIKNDLVIIVRPIPLLITSKNKSSFFTAKIKNSGSRALEQRCLYC